MVNSRNKVLIYNHIATLQSPLIAQLYRMNNASGSPYFEVNSNLLYAMCITKFKYSRLYS
jgi:flagellar motor switch protein FliM